MPTKFADIAKAPSDLLSDDYSTKVTLKCKKPAGPIAVTLETERGSGGALSAKVGTKFVGGGVSFDKVQLKADGGHVLETSLKPCSGVVMSFKGNKGADLGIDYTKGNFVATGTLDVKDMSKFSTSACVGVSPAVNLGGSAAYSMAGKSCTLSAYSVGGSYKSGPLFAAATTGSKLSSVNLGVLYKVNDTLSVASCSTHSSAAPLGSFTVGCAYKADFGNVKAKVGNDGLVTACLSKEVAPKVTVTATGSIASLDTSTIKYGLGIVM